MLITSAFGICGKKIICMVSNSNDSKIKVPPHPLCNPHHAPRYVIITKTEGAKLSVASREPNLGGVSKSSI